MVVLMIGAMVQHKVLNGQNFDAAENTRSFAGLYECVHLEEWIRRRGLADFMLDQNYLCIIRYSSELFAET